MYLIILTSACLIGSIIALILSDHLYILNVLGIIGSFIFGIAFSCEIIILIIVYGCLPGDVIHYDEKHTAIQHEIDLLSIETDDYTKMEVTRDIQEWNESIVSGQYWSQNLWVGVFWSEEFYNRYEPFDYPGVLTSQN